MIPHADTMLPIDAAEDALTGGILPRRIMAFAVDWLIVTILAAAAWVALLLFGLVTLGLGLPLLGLLPAVPVLYNWLFTAGIGQATPGQAMLGLRLVRDDDLGRPNSAQAFVWSLGFAATVALGAVWLLLALVTRRHRAAHDIVAGVSVVRAAAVGTSKSTLTGRGGRAKVVTGNIWAA